MKNGKGVPLIPMGVTHHAFVEKRIGLPEPLMFTHMLVAGASGSGKSTLLIHMDLAWSNLSGHVSFYFDTKGDETRLTIARIPHDQRHRIVWLQVKHANFAANILDTTGTIFPSAYHSASGVSKIIDDVSKRRGDTQSPRQYKFLQQMMYATMKGVPLLEGIPSCLADVKRFLIDKPFRDELLHVLAMEYPEDGHLVQIYHEMKEIEKDVTFDALLNKLHPLTDEPVLSKIFAQRQSSLDLRRMVTGAEEAIVFVDLSDLPLEILHLAGALLFECFLNACFLRPPQDRIPVLFILDEFYLYWAQSMSAVTRARSYNISLVYAMQSEASIAPALMRTILDSIGTTVAMRCGGNYARLLARQFGGVVKYQDLVRLPNFHAWIKTPTQIFSFQTTPLPEAVAVPEVIPLPPPPVTAAPFPPPVDEIAPGAETEEPAISFTEESIAGHPYRMERIP